jgi:phosphatidylserine/phosphatidylglycerophosphate/cardiolipin synthase-like enzyme
MAETLLKVDDDSNYVEATDIAIVHPADEKQREPTRDDLTPLMDGLVAHSEMNKRIDEAQNCIFLASRHRRATTLVSGDTDLRIMTQLLDAAKCGVEVGELSEQTQ